MSTSKYTLIPPWDFAEPHWETVDFFVSLLEDGGMLLVLMLTASVFIGWLDQLISPEEKKTHSMFLGYQ